MLKGKTAVGFCVVVLLALTGCAASDPEDPGQPVTGSGGKPAEVNDTDLHFLAMMTPHHDQAVEMSDIVLAAEGISAETLDLAERIKTGQQEEIDVMLGWVADWNQSVLLAQHSEHIANGMVTPQQMQQLGMLSGADAERRFLEDMRFHHEGAIAMTRDQIANGGYAALRDLAQQMIDVQTAEIAEMDVLLERP